MKKKDTTKHFSIVDFVDLNRNGSVFINGSEEQFLNVVKKSKTIKRNFRSAEEEVKRLRQNEQQWLKGQLISKCLFGCLQLNQKTNKNVFALPL